MSASLVGSEMCIRDSLPGRALCAPRVTAGGASPSRRRRGGARRRRGGACLLYTSDAADDM
eukprot:6263835-Alexandrium_andersonii.AAC.1